MKTQEIFHLKLDLFTLTELQVALGAFLARMLVGHRYSVLPPTRDLNTLFNTERRL